MAELEQQASPNLLQDLAPTGALLGSFVAVIAATTRLSANQDLGTLQALLVALGGVISAVIVFVRRILHLLRNPPPSPQSERDQLLGVVDRAWVKGGLRPDDKRDQPMRNRHGT